MKKLKFSLVFVLAIAAMLFISSCTMLFPTMQQTCTVHRDLNRDTYCDVCNTYVPIPCTNHVDANHDGKCDSNGCTVELEVEHYDEDHDGRCDEELCKKKNLPVEHEDKDKNRKCDVCGAKIDTGCDCEDDDGDGYCDECGEEMYVCDSHVDKDKDGECDDCGAEIKEECDEHTDANKDGKCDECGAEVEATECDHTDANFDGKCDLCKEAMADSIAFYENGTTKFKFVMASGIPGSHVRLVDELVSQLKKLGIEVSLVDDKAATASDFEVLFGVCSSRGDEYKLDPHVYGMEGYAVKLIGTKIVVVSGSDDSFDDAIAALKETFLGITDTTRKLTTRYISESMNVDEIQDDYKVSTITLYDKDIKGYTIAVDKTNTTTFTTAKKLQEMLYSQTGYWLDLVSLEEADKSIVISMAKKNPEKEGFYATFTDGKIEFVSEYPTVVYNKVINFFTQKIAGADETLNLTDKDNFVSDVRYVYYKDYGAVGDGAVDDSEAIRAAHEYANQGGHKVIASNGATYYMGKMEKAIPIKTDVDWLDATFIIDDSGIEPLEKIGDTNAFYRSVNIFSVQRTAAISSAEFKEVISKINASGGIDASTFKKFDIEFGQPLLIAISNTDHKNYVRYGVNASDGASQKEVILVDEHGNIDPTTPFMHDFEKINSYTLYPISDEPITIEGGSFYTRPFLDPDPQGYNAYGRGIACGRSNVTFKNVKHFLENEGEYNYNNHANSTDYGCPYGGFFSTDYSNNVVYENCQFSAHIVYKGSNGAGMGTYDLSPGYATNVLYDRCYQTDDNFFNASGQNRWGVMGSSYCKNVTFKDSKLTRFDAHNGIHNAYIINTEIKMIRINGTGTFVMDGCTMHSNLLVGLREDYGGFWDGNIILKNNTMITDGIISLFSNTWYNHYFGYPARYPTNIIIDGLTIYKDKNGTPNTTAIVHLFNSGMLNVAEKSVMDYIPVTDSNGLATYYPDNTPVVLANKNQAPAPENIVIRNCEDINWDIPSASAYPWLENTNISVNEYTKCENHFDFDGNLKCDDCGADFTPCTTHTDYNNDGKCTWCATDVEIKCDKHIDKDINGKCDVCDKPYVCSGHLDENSDRICDICGGVLGCKDAHVDAFVEGKTEGDGYCDVCKKLIPTCETCSDGEKLDGNCDECGANIVTLIDPCETCVDENGDSECDVCHKNLTTEPACEHIDETGAENAPDGKCDLCDEDMPTEPACEHIDETGAENAPDGKCDLCDEDMPSAA